MVLLCSTMPTFRSDHMPSLIWSHGVNDKVRVKLKIWRDCMHGCSLAGGLSWGFFAYLEIDGVGGCAEINIQQRCTQVKGRQFMTAWINIVPCSAAITAHEQVAEIIDGPKMLSEPLDQTANWVSTYMITSDGLTTGHIPLLASKVRSI